MYTKQGQSVQRSVFFLQIRKDKETKIIDITQTNKPDIQKIGEKKIIITQQQFFNTKMRHYKGKN
mgnify:CR=1 FL=1